MKIAPEQLVTPQSSSAPPHWLFVLCFVLSGVLLYRDNLTNAFVFDDIHLILNNALVYNPHNFWQIFTSHYWPDAGPYRPLPIASFALTYRLFGDTPLPYHVFNDLLHGLNSGLLFLLTLRITASRSIALATSLVFLLCGVHIETVSLVTGRAELLAGGLLLSSLLCFLQTLQSPKRPIFWHGLAIFFGTAAMLSKETSAGLPFLVAAIARWHGRRSNKQVAGFAALYLLPMLLYASLRLLLFPDFIPTGGFSYFGSTPVSHRFYTMLAVVSHYCSNMLWPWPYIFDYSKPSVPHTTSFLDGMTLAGVAILVCMLFLIFRHKHSRNAPFLAIGATWFTVGLLPVSNILPTGSLMANRFLYIPAMGFSLLIIVFLVSALHLQALRSAARAFISGILGSAFTLGSGFVIVHVNRAIATETSFWRFCYKQNPRSAMTLLNVAYVEYRDGDLREAETLAKTAWRTGYEHPRANFILGLIASAEHRQRNAERFFLRAVELEPTTAEFLHNLGVFYAQTGRSDLALQAISRIEQLNKESPATMLFKGTILEDRKDFNSAKALYKSIMQSPRPNKEAQKRLGIVLAKEQAYTEALQHLLPYLQRNEKGDAEAQFFAGIAFANLKRPREALPHFLHASRRGYNLPSSAYFLLECAYAERDTKAMAEAVSIIGDGTGLLSTDQQQRIATIKGALP